MRGFLMLDAYFVEVLYLDNYLLLASNNINIFWLWTRMMAIQIITSLIWNAIKSLKKQGTF